LADKATEKGKGERKAPVDAKGKGRERRKVPDEFAPSEPGSSRPRRRRASTLQAEPAKRAKPMAGLAARAGKIRIVGVIDLAEELERLEEDLQRQFQEQAEAMRRWAVLAGRVRQEFELVVGHVQGATSEDDDEAEEDELEEDE
jgi:hypothetical protein